MCSSDLGAGACSSPTGPGMLPAGIILAIMTLPIITAISRDALISVPSSLRQAALGIGATRWETIFQVIIPAAFSGIVGAVMLANQFAEASGLQVSALMYAALVLFVLTLIVNILAELIVTRVQRL